MVETRSRGVRLCETTTVVRRASIARRGGASGRGGSTTRGGRNSTPGRGTSATRGGRGAVVTRGGRSNVSGRDISTTRGGRGGRGRSGGDVPGSQANIASDDVPTTLASSSMASIVSACNPIIGDTTNNNKVVRARMDHQTIITAPAPIVNTNSSTSVMIPIIEDMVPVNQNKNYLWLKRICFLLVVCFGSLFVMDTTGITRNNVTSNYIYNWFKHVSMNVLDIYNGRQNPVPNYNIYFVNNRKSSEYSPTESLHEIEIRSNDDNEKQRNLLAQDITKPIIPSADPSISSPIDSSSDSSTYSKIVEISTDVSSDSSIDLLTDLSHPTPEISDESVQDLSVVPSIDLSSDSSIYPSAEISIATSEDLSTKLNVDLATDSSIHPKEYSTEDSENDLSGAPSLELTDSSFHPKVESSKDLVKKLLINSVSDSLTHRTVESSKDSSIHEEMDSSSSDLSSEPSKDTSLHKSKEETLSKKPTILSTIDDFIKNIFTYEVILNLIIIIIALLILYRIYLICNIKKSGQSNENVNHINKNEEILTNDEILNKFNDSFIKINMIQDNNQMFLDKKDQLYTLIKDQPDFLHNYQKQINLLCMMSEAIKYKLETNHSNQT